MKSTRILAQILAALLLIAALSGCSPQPSPTDAGTVQTATAAETPAEPASTPKEPVTLKIMCHHGPDTVAVGDVKWMQEYQKKVNVIVEWMDLGDTSQSREKLNILISGGDYGDVLLSNVLDEAGISRLSANGVFVPLNDYLTPELTPNIIKIFEISPNTKGIITAPDGKIYSLFNFIDLPQNFLESPFWINKAWLDKLGKNIPATLEEFTDVLKAFKTGDPNGNGKEDEIPYIISETDSYSHFEVFMGLYGIPTKNNNFDSYLVIRNGKVIFAPMLPEYKEAIKSLSSLYQEGLIWNESFTATPETFAAKLTAAEASYGVVTKKQSVPANIDQYVCMAPPKVSGYEPLWYYHPGGMGTKNLYSVFDKCKDVETAMIFADGFYDFDNSVQIQYGMPGEGAIELKDGMYKFVAPPAGKSQTQVLKQIAFRQVMGCPHAIINSDFGTRIEMSDAQKKGLVAYDVYKPFLNKEIWPRPYFSADDSTRVSELRTDIFNTVQKYKASWISGQSDIEDDWDKFKAELDKMGIAEFISIMQESYDVYLKAFQQ